VRRAELTGLSAHSRRGGGAGSVNFSPFITSVGQSAHGQLKADLVPSGLKGAVESIYQDSVARADATRLLALLEPFLVTASYHFKISCNSPRTTPILGPGAQVNTAELRDIIIKVSNHCKRLTLREPRLLALESPCHVLGDLHGNLVDLNFFKTVLWPAGPSAAAGSFLFLGDFVDRGPDSIAVVAYVMAMKCLEPSRWWAIRGNHETREVNGNTDHYGSGSFLWQSLEMFGEEGGHGVWEAVNGWFDALPLAATIDNAIFCVHGGIPQALCEGDATLDRISQVPCPLQTAHSNQMVYDMLWSDPSTADQEDTGEIGNGVSSSPTGFRVSFNVSFTPPCQSPTG
jgi:diadenosine tetraphosphatase ApaH/serine/threonine PP2A family protein phosphatase